MARRFIMLMAGFALSLGAVGCDNARTSADAPATIDGETNDPAQVGETLEDGSSEVRQAQLDSDIRAREQRNDLVGDQTERTDADLESEVRAKLEANIPRAKLTVEAEGKTVTIAGTVPDQKEYETIEPLAKEILGVDMVTVNVDVVPPVE